MHGPGNEIKSSKTFWRLSCSVLIMTKKKRLFNSTFLVDSRIANYLKSQRFKNIILIFTVVIIQAVFLQTSIEPTH